MAKMRIIALAKEMGFKTSKEILDFLNVDGKDRKAQSNIEDSEIDKVKAHFSGQGQTKDGRPVGRVIKAQKPSAPAKPEEEAASPAQSAPGTVEKTGPDGKIARVIKAPVQSSQPQGKPQEGAPKKDRGQGDGSEKKDKGGAQPQKNNSGIVFISSSSSSWGGSRSGRDGRGGQRGGRGGRPQVDSDTVRAAFAKSLGGKAPAPQPAADKSAAASTPAPAPSQAPSGSGKGTAPAGQAGAGLAGTGTPAAGTPATGSAGKGTASAGAGAFAPAPASTPAASPAGTPAPAPAAAPEKEAAASEARDNTSRRDGKKEESKGAKDNRSSTLIRDNAIIGPRIIRHEEVVRDNDKRDGRTGRGGKRRDEREQRAQGGKKKEGIQRDGGGFAISSNNPRFGDNRSQGQRRDQGKGSGSQAGSKIFISGSASKGSKGWDRRKDDKRRGFDRDDEQQVRNKKANPHGFHKPEKVEKEEEKIKVITLPEKMTIRELAEKMKIQPAQIVKKLFLEGKIYTVNSEVTYEEAENIAIEYDIICEQEEKIDVIAELLKEEEEDEASMVRRPPVVCVMGHVDHGKTSLLDAVRKSNVTDREAGGITQHIGAYTVNLEGRNITFLDTPGHEAFTAMRMRGANSTDIAILVVAADDGVMPQTVEAINHAKAAGIEIIVAINKIDKPNANIDRVKQELAEYELIPEDWGGSTVFALVSAKSGQGIQELLEMVLLTADILELKANPSRRARGLVIEAELDKGRGPVATMLVQKGTLHVGDFIAAGATHGKVRAMIDDKGRKVKEAGPSTPVEILGLNDVPEAGDVFVSPENDREAKNFADTFIEQNRLKLLEDTKTRMTLDDVFSQIQEGNLKELNIIVKADVQGSVEAVKTSLLKLSNEEVVVKVIHSGVGAINESDVILASASNAIIIGFNVRIDSIAKGTAETEGVDVRLYKVIYQAIEDVEAAMKGMLDPIFEEKVIGHAEVRQIFKASGVGNIAGSYVLDGVFERGCKVRISRQGEQLFEGDLASLKRFKDDVKEVKAGFECGLVFDGWGDMQELDIVEAYKMVEVPR